jgi:uncharacterized protein
MSNYLIVFTRYPEPGKTKTRMISLLGDEGAAMLQRQMTEYTIKKVKQLSSIFPVLIAIYFAGGDRQSMQDWLGTGFIYQPQSEGDLGQRMRLAFDRAFVADMKKVIIIGTDCPELNTTILSEAVDALNRYDLVLGPAADGGYYLIGLSRLIPELFADISWGTSEVLAQTRKIAQKLQLSLHYLPILRDVDRPEDLYIWQQLNI